MESTDKQVSTTYNSQSSAIEVLSKSFAAFAGTLYVCGFLITSIYYSQFGFTEANPLKARIFSAGAWFLLLIAMPLTYIGPFIQKGREYASRTDVQWVSLANITFAYFVCCSSTAFIFHNVFHNSHSIIPEEHVRNTYRNSLTVAMYIVLYLVIFSQKIPKRISALAASVFLGLFILGNVNSLTANEFSFGSLTLWFFGVGVVVAFETGRRLSIQSTGHLPGTVGIVLGMLLFFALYYYPHIKSSLGGGDPAPVIIYLNKDSAIKPNQELRGFLIDESDTGIYATENLGRKATFIPRSAIGAIYFSDDYATSSFK